MYTTKEALILQIERTQEKLSEMRDELEALNNPYGGEPDIGHILKWHVQFDRGGKVYTYVAVRSSDGLWSTTGGDRKRFCWTELCNEWEKRGVKIDSIYYMTAWKTLN